VGSIPAGDMSHGERDIRIFTFLSQKSLLPSRCQENQRLAAKPLPAKIIGHESAVVFRIYTNIDTETLQAAISKMPNRTA
jgi:hypothetical protein